MATFSSSDNPFFILLSVPFLYLPSFRFSLRLRVLWLLNLRSLLLSLWLLNSLLRLLSWLLSLRSLLLSLWLLNSLLRLLSWLLSLRSLLLSLRLLNSLLRLSLWLTLRFLNLGLSLLLLPLLVLLNFRPLL